MSHCACGSPSIAILGARACTAGELGAERYTGRAWSVVKPILEERLVNPIGRARAGFQPGLNHQSSAVQARVERAGRLRAGFPPGCGHACCGTEVPWGGGFGGARVSHAGGYKRLI